MSRCPKLLTLAVAIGVVWTSDDSMAQRPRTKQPATPATGRRQPADRPAATGGAPQARQYAQAPFRLTAEEEATLEMVLRAWEARSAKIKTWTCDFVMLKYDGVFRNGQEPNKSLGELKYAAPDKGMYRVEGEGGEYWVCDGRSIYQFDYQEKQLVEHPLPEELQGKAIADGPLPFLFGASADKMRERYWMRLLPPPANAPDEIWLEAWPRFRQDAANFQQVQVILNPKDLLPTALNMTLPNGDSRKTYLFREHKINNPLEKLLGHFGRPRVPFGWKHVVEEPRSQRPAGGAVLPPQAERPSQGGALR